MADLTFLVLTLVAFAAFVGLIRLCDRIVGDAEDEHRERAPRKAPDVVR